MADAREPREGHLQLLLPRAPVHARRVPGRLRATLDELWLGDGAETWRSLGFTVGDDATLDVGAVRLRVGQPGEGIVACALRGADLGQLDGLTTHPSTAPERTPAPPHPNGVSGVDHVVAATPDFGRTLAALRAAGLEPRRLREAGPGLRQAFYVLGPALLELAGPAEPDGTDPATFWGLTLVADDLDALASRLGPLLGPVTDAVQPGRRIATLRREAGVATAVAFMTPR